MCIHIFDIDMQSETLILDLEGKSESLYLKNQEEDPIPFSNLTSLLGGYTITMYQYLKNGIEGQEHKYNISHSLENRYVNL